VTLAAACPCNSVIIRSCRPAKFPTFQTFTDWLQEHIVQFTYSKRTAAVTTSVYQCLMNTRLGTLVITSSQPLMLLLAVFVYDPLTWIVSVPRCWLSMYGCRAFYHAGLTVWNSLPGELKNSDRFDGLKWFLKQFFSAATSVTSPSEVFQCDALDKTTF